MIVRNMTAVIIATTIGTQRYTLKPGVNDVPPEIWEKWRATPVMQAKIKADKIREPEVEDVAEREPEVATLEKLSINKAVDLVKHTFDLELLEKWVLEEKREKVLKALEKQIEAVEVKAKKDQGEGGDENADPEGDDDQAGGDEKPKPGQS